MHDLRRRRHRRCLELPGVAQLGFARVGSFAGVPPPRNRSDSANAREAG